ncbi:hypothetical protein BKA67DRAFT_672321 [Truncatella angustata]|uniref:Uncharacterized protein n=1 Tax=Truncatella angustata TaxID=152316 RepID=A0A9P8UR41_9PEZI|nr:uncharacterized protein BKA67DRAFT_672321 [Truncatella angustata]KAH6656572.1 hypothetical protein BKA67DRAFT_672321 [Truncatella angustata]KAH8196543.1 hypothetical protein TruAng_009305 [Truncatella angustata]
MSEEQKDILRRAGFLEGLISRWSPRKISRNAGFAQEGLDSYQEMHSALEYRAITWVLRCRDKNMGAYWKSPTPGQKSYHAKELVQYLLIHCRVKGSDKDLLLENFRQRFDRDVAYFEAHGLSIYNFHKVLESYMAALDYMFFDGLITNPESVAADTQPHGQLFMPRRYTAKLRVNHGAEPSGKMIAKWYMGTVEMYTHGVSGAHVQQLTLPQVVSTLAHELVHAFLDIFAWDDDVVRRTLHVGYKPPVHGYTKGHGPAFWSIYRFVACTLRDCAGPTAGLAFINDAEVAAKLYEDMLDLWDIV